MYLYHGSNIANVEILEPRQAFNGTSADGEPAVFASSDIEVAIFMALVGANRWGGWDYRRYPGRGFYVYEEFTDYLTSSDYGIEGHVYFLPSESFADTESIIRHTSELVRPLGMITVDATDLPKDITILDVPHPYYVQ